ncbi:MAG: PHP domain-containing protein [archaeon]
MKNADLHTHSYYSDGELPPKEVVRRAKRKGIKYLALTDHNSVEGIPEAIKEGKKIGVSVIPAIEIRAQEDEVLGYFVDYKNREFEQEIRIIQDKLIGKIKKTMKKLNQIEIKVTFSDLLKEYHPNKNFMEIHLIKYLHNKGYGPIRELYDEYISNKECKTYVPLKEISVINSIKLIKKYGGVPVLAHPWVEPQSKKLLEEKRFKQLINAGLEGIEIDNGDRDERRDEKTIKKIKLLSKKYNLIITSGSDFHGNSLTEANRYHGMGRCNCDEKIVKQLKILKEVE